MNIGDAVRLKTGGPEMTILAINESEHNDDDDTLLCGFFTIKDSEWDKFKTVRIHPDALIFVKEPVKEIDHA